MRRLLLLTLAVLCLPCDVCAGETVVAVKRPLSPPAWALLERELLRVNTAACREARGSRWGCAGT